MLRVFLHYPKEKVLYIAPLKALVRERMSDWGPGLCRSLGKRLVELTGDFTPDVAALLAADVIVCTPEKWDGISRSWQARAYVRSVRLVVMDEIHLLGSERGPTLEVIVSRMRYISGITGRPVRFVGLSTALANAHDLAAWLGVKPSVRLFRFRSIACSTAFDSTLSCEGPRVSAGAVASLVANSHHDWDDLVGTLTSTQAARPACSCE